MLILGVNRSDHDVSAALVEDGILKAFLSAERITRIKHDKTRVWEAVRYCLETAGVSQDAIDLVVQNSYVKDVDAFDALIASKNQFSPEAEFFRQFPSVHTVSHHLAHAFCGVGLSAFHECAVLVADGIGQHRSGNQAEAESYFHFKNGELELLHQRLGTLLPDGLGIHSFDSLGGLYSMVSSYLFGDWDYCGKVMGLAPHGGEKPYAKSMIHKDGPNLHIDLAFRDYLDGPIEDASTKWQTDRATAESLAFAVQVEIEEALLHAARWLYERTKCKHLVFAGGVALNCVANERILTETPFQRMFIPPPAGDDGIAIGCAFYGWHVLCGGEKRFSLSHPYYGKVYADEQIRPLLKRELLVETDKPKSIESTAARHIASGKVLGWFQGASAMGPRALGDRSILADPRDPSMRDFLNLRVKHRERFRPYGASVLAEKAPEYFAISDDKPYMTFAVEVRKEIRAEIPAVVHVDGTSRIQTVRQEEHPRFHRLLVEFYERTGIPLVLNTSFNRKGEPIVETPDDALRAFLNMELDALAIEDYWVTRRMSDERLLTDGRLLECRMVTERAFDIVERRYPDGVRQHCARLPAGHDNGSVCMSSETVALLAYADRNVSVDRALREVGIERSVPTVTNSLRTLLALHKAGWLRLETDH